MRAAVAAPVVEVTVDGGTLDEAAHTALASVRVARRLSLPAQCEIGFVLEPAPDGPAGPDLARMLPIGGELAVVVAGDHGQLFAGDITGHEWVHAADGCAELRVRAYDLLHRLRKRQRVVARTDLTVADLASDLASEAGLDVDATEDGPRWPVLMQHRQSDLELLQEVAERAGLWFAVADGTLHLFSLEGFDGLFDDPVELTLHDQLLTARFDATAEPACRAVTALGWDPVTAGGIEGGAKGARSSREVDVAVGPDTVDADGDRFLVGRHGPTADHLDAAAQGELDRRVAQEVTLSGTAEGDARLQPGRRVQVRGPAPDVAGTYLLTATTHTVDASGYLVELSTQPPARGRTAEDATAATLAQVTAVDDPDGLGRVRVALPAYADVETDWREVVVPGAGAGKGIVALPDVDDRVLVLLPQGDPAAAIVLGGLYGEGSPVDPGIVGRAVRRWSLVTPGGQRVLLDDEHDRVTVANDSGSTVMLTPDKVTIHAACDLDIQAPGHTMTLRANRIEMVQATSAEDSPAEGMP